MNNVSQKPEKIYFGLDISQKNIEIYALKGEKGVSFGKITNTRQGLVEFFNKLPWASESIVVALETGTHSAWISHLLEVRGYEVIVAHARDLAFIYKGDKKSDRIDAEKLARVARADKKLLHPVKLMDVKRQEDLLAIKARDLLIKERTCIINAIRGFLRSFGIDDTEYSHETINQMYEVLPEEIRQNLRGLFETLKSINVSIKNYDKRIERINALAKKAREEGLTEAEKAEQKKLREEYLADFRQSFRRQLENTDVKYEDGETVPLTELRKKNLH